MTTLTVGSFCCSMYWYCTCRHFAGLAEIVRLYLTVTYDCSERIAWYLTCSCHSLIYHFLPHLYEVKGIAESNLHRLCNQRSGCCMVTAARALSPSIHHRSMRRPFCSCSVRLECCGGASSARIPTAFGHACIKWCCNMQSRSCKLPSNQHMHELLSSFSLTPQLLPDPDFPPGE